MTGNVETAWDSLIGDLYLAAVDQQASARVAPALARLLNAGTAAYWSLDKRTGALTGRLLTNFVPENMALYAAHWYAYDPWTLPLAQQGVEGVVRGAQLIEDSKLVRHPFYAEYGVRTGHFHVMGSILQPSARTPNVGCIAVQRDRHLGAFTDTDFAMLERLLPHARRARQLDARLEGQLHPLLAGRAALDAMDTATITLLGTGMVVHANTAAEALDRDASVIRLRQAGEDGRIAALRSTDTVWLRAAIANAARGGPGGAGRLLGVDEATYAAVVTPLPKRFSEFGEVGCLPGMALLTIRKLDPLAADQSLEDLCVQVFGFTRAEAQAATMLTNGSSPEEIAEARDVRISTIRSLLKRAMDKSGAPNLRRLTLILASLRGIRPG